MRHSYALRSAEAFVFPFDSNLVISDHSRSLVNNSQIKRPLQITAADSIPKIDVVKIFYAFALVFTVDR